MSTSEDVTAVMEAAKSGVPATIRRLMRDAGLSTRQLGAPVGLTRQALSARLNGDQGFRYEEVRGIAEALGVTTDVLEMEPDDALRWVLDHKEEVEHRRVIFTCSTPAHLLGNNLHIPLPSAS